MSKWVSNGGGQFEEFEDITFTYGGGGGGVGRSEPGVFIISLVDRTQPNGFQAIYIAESDDVHGAFAEVARRDEIKGLHPTYCNVIYVEDPQKRSGIVKALRERYHPLVG